MNTVREKMYNEYLNVVTEVDTLEEVYICLKNHLLFLFDEEPENLEEIQVTSNRLAITLQKIKHNNNVIAELKEILYN